MIDVLADDVLSLDEARALFPKRHGKRPHFSTVWRWATVGCRGARLETVRVGRVLFTSPAAIREFVAAMSAGDNPASRGVPTRPAVLSAKAAETFWQSHDAATAERRKKGKGSVGSGGSYHVGEPIPLLAARKRGPMQAAASDVGERNTP